MNAGRFIAGKLRFKGRLAAVAVAVSFFVMIISTAISSGFRHEIREALSELSGDMLIDSGEEPMDARPECLGAIEAVKGVVSVSPVIWKPAIIQGDGDLCGVLVKGVPAADSSSLQARIPSTLASRMHLAEGDLMTTWFVDDKLKARRFKVASVYESISDGNESMVIQVPISDLQRVCGWSEDEASALELRLEPRFRDLPQLWYKAEEVRFSTLDEDGTMLRVKTVRERYPQLFDWLDLTDFNVSAILLLMTIVAGFNMISGLLILLFRHISTIGMLKSMGMTDRGIAGVFLRVAARMVLLGMAAGNATALLFCILQGSTHFLRLNPANYFVSFVPVHIDVALILLVDAVAFAAIMLLLLIPSLFISRIDPARSVRVR